MAISKNITLLFSKQLFLNDHFKLPIETDLKYFIPKNINKKEITTKEREILIACSLTSKGFYSN